MLKAAIVGYGGICQAAHAPGWKILEEKGIGKLVAAYDIDESQFTKKQEINIGSSDVKLDLRTYTDLEKMLAAEDLDVIDICAPTSEHAPIAIELLKRGYHVHSEKPMARTSALCKQMLEAAAAPGSGKLMIGQCLRFSDPYRFLKDSLNNNTFGKPLSGVFRRLSSPPLWSWDNWLMDHKRSGGCMMDMHIHDVDMVRFLFGEPESVFCKTADVYSGDDIVQSTMNYDGFSMLAIGDWSQEGVGFIADYRVGFEKATVVYSDDKVTVFPRDGESWSPEFPDESMYMKELEYFLTVVIPGGKNELNPPESAAMSVELVERLKAAAQA